MKKIIGLIINNIEAVNINLILFIGNNSPLLIYVINRHSSFNMRIDIGGVITETINKKIRTGMSRFAIGININPNIRSNISIIPVIFLNIILSPTHTFINIMMF